jgi:hypothetical protein
VTLPEATLSLREGLPSLTVTDETQIPVTYWREKVIRTLDKVALGDDLRAGRNVDGATLGNAQPVLTVRRS